MTPLIHQPVTYTAGGGKKKMYFCLRLGPVDIHYCLAFGTITLGQLGGYVCVSRELAKEIYRAVIDAAPDGLYLLGEAEAVAPMLREEDEAPEEAKAA